jgi:ATP-binding cassette subfamily F protein uup
VQDWLTQAARAQGAVAGSPWGAKTSSGKLGDKTLAAKGQATAAAPAAVPSPSVTPTAKRKLSYKEQRELEALPAQMEALEQEQQQIDQKLADGHLYANDPAQAALLSARHGEIEEALMTALERWEQLGGV